MTYIIVPDSRIVVPGGDPLAGQMHMSGWYKIEKFKAGSDGKPIEGTREVVADWFPNIITDQGLNRIGTSSDWLSACQIGSGTAMPLATNTGLQSFLAGSSSIPATVEGAQATPPHFGWCRNTYRFAAGLGTGNISEVGVGWATTGSTLFSRALVLDAGQQPITITKFADEVLDVTYEFRNHAPASDVTGNVTITGSGTHAFVTRASFVTFATQRWAVSQAGLSGGVTINGSPSSVFNGAIGAVTGQPSGTSAATGSNSNTNLAYSNNSMQRAGTIPMGLNDGNLAGGIRSIRYSFGGGFGGLGVFQTEFTPTINKTSSQVLTLNVLHAWGRGP